MEQDGQMSSHECIDGYGIVCPTVVPVAVASVVTIVAALPRPMSTWQSGRGLVLIERVGFEHVVLPEGRVGGWYRIRIDLSIRTEYL